ncbi:MAG: site-specific DNA-methyltransferase [Alistipes sp.]
METGVLPNGKPWKGNMLIHGDNLLALKALEQDYAGCVKCIYIDPPYNTGNAFEHYDDGVEHSIWLSLMRERLVLLYNLLSNDGSIWIQIDDNEMAYLIALCDEIFGRSNRVNIIALKMSETSGVKMAHVEKKLPKLKEFIIVYKKGELKLNPIKITKSKNLESYLKYYNQIITNYDSPCEEWIIEKIEDVMCRIGLDTSPDSIRNFKLNNSERIIYRTNNKSFNQYKFTDNIKTRKIVSPTGLTYVWWEGKQMLFLSDYTSEYLGDLWTDISTINLNKEGGVDFVNSKKPEKLIERVIALATNTGDLVLDSFLGSGTTAAVAQKMGRKYIGIEMGNHAYTHCAVRLKKVVDGTDQGGISKAQNWKGGGGFRFYELAPSLLKEDKFGNLIINKEYNADMLAAAMAKQEGFTYAPSNDIYWKQGFSSESDYIYTTTQFMTVEGLTAIAAQMKEGESLLICCTAFQKECLNAYPNITIKKIPQMLLGRCQFNKDDYSLNIIELPDMQKENDVEESSTDESVECNDVTHPSPVQPSLF